VGEQISAEHGAEVSFAIEIRPGPALWYFEAWRLEGDFLGEQGGDLSVDGAGISRK
jgi:hypothetical protein